MNTLVNYHHELSERRMKSLELPIKGGKTKKIKSDQCIAIIGANGSGKTRLGSWIEIKSTQNKVVHRISAHKSLAMPDSTKSEEIDISTHDLLYGTKNLNVFNKSNRWMQKPATHLQNDFEKLFSYLFSIEIEENAKYKKISQNSQNRIDTPVTLLDKVKMIWEEILPLRELIIHGLKIETKIRNSPGSEYSCSEMSDGERVVFYLIGQCLAAPKDGIIVVDEPELHLHKSIRNKLWNKIEEIRQDCLFVYLTHDINFLAAKTTSAIIWVQSFDGNEWDWKEIDYESEYPDELLFELLGNRKPVVFVEGTNGKTDVSFYRELLSDYLVIPCGSCSKVIQYVKAYKENKDLHHFEIYGIIDRDRRVNKEIQLLKKDNIYTLDVAEVENLFCTKELLNIVSNHLGKDPVQDFSKVSSLVFKKLESEIETQISLKVSDEIKFLLNKFNTKKKGVGKIEGALNDLISGIDVNKIYTDCKSSFDDVISNSDYKKLLQIYNRKSLATQISKILGLANGMLPEIVLNLIKKPELKQPITEAIKPYFGDFQNYM